MVDNMHSDLFLVKYYPECMFPLVLLPSYECKTAKKLPFSFNIVRAVVITQQNFIDVFHNNKPQHAIKF